MEKDTEFNLFVGAPRSGKSTFSAQVIKKYKQNVIIVKHTSNINDSVHSFLPEKTMSNWRQGVAKNGFVKCKMAFHDKKSYLAFLDWVTAENFKNGLLIIDDATIFERYKLSDAMTLIAGMRRHYGINLCMIYHGFTATPIDQYTFVNRLVIFNCNDNITRKKNDIPKYEQIQKAILMSKQNYMSTNPKIKFKPTIVDITTI